MGLKWWDIYDSDMFYDKFPNHPTHRFSVTKYFYLWCNIDSTKCTAKQRNQYFEHMRSSETNMKGLKSREVDLCRVICIDIRNLSCTDPDSVFLVHSRIMRAQMTHVRRRFVHVAIMTYFLPAAYMLCVSKSMAI